MAIGNTIRGGVKWVLTGKVAHQMLHFAISVALARLLLPEHFGLVVTVQVFTGLAGFVAGGGMGQALVQAPIMTLRDTHVVFTAQLVIGALLYGLFFFIAPWFAVWFDEPIYKDLLRVSAITFLIRPFANTPSSILHREMRFKAKAFISVSILMVTGVTSISLAALGFGVWSLVLGGIAGAVTNVFLANIVARWRPGLAIDKGVLRRLGGYGLKVSAVDIVVYLRAQSANLIISRFIGPAAVGLFNKADSLKTMPTKLISASTRTVVFRALSKNQENLDQSKYIFLRTITLVSAYVFPALVGLGWVAEPFIYTVYGPNWVEAAPALEILVLAGFFASVGMQGGAVAAARKMLGRELVIQSLGLALLLAGTLYAYRWGITGVAWVVVGVSALTSALMIRLASRELRVKPKELLRALQPAFLLNAILAGALFALHVLALGSFKDTQPAVYLLTMAIFGGTLYGVCFLYLPIPQLTKEAQRWKHRLHLPCGPSVP